MDQQKKELLEALSGVEEVPVDIEGEWKLRGDGRDVRQRCLGDQTQEEPQEACAALWGLIRDKDYHVVITVMDRAVCDMDSDSGQVVVPCGDIHWRQCSKAYTKDIWEGREVSDDICPHCKALLTGSTVDVRICIEEGYLPRWGAYKKWQMRTLDRRLVILELGEGFKTSTVMRWPFGRIGFFNQKSMFCGIHKAFYQIPEEMGEWAVGIQADSVVFIRGLAED